MGNPPCQEFGATGPGKVVVDDDHFEVALRELIEAVLRAGGAEAVVQSVALHCPFRQRRIEGIVLDDEHARPREVQGLERPDSVHIPSA